MDDERTPALYQEKRQQFMPFVWCRMIKGALQEAQVKSEQ
jgi:hypothetical protein